MNKRNSFCTAAALSLLGVALAQAQQTPPADPPTSQTEGTAADRTQPGETPTRGTPRQPTDDPRPSTSETEGTAADRTEPGKTPTAQGEAAKRGEQRSEIIGAQVVTRTNAKVGEVVDVVFDSMNQPAFVVISSSEGKAVAVPYQVANSMMAADKIVIDQSRLEAAPKIKEGQWRSESSSWKIESSRYWDRGG